MHEVIHASTRCNIKKAASRTDSITRCTTNGLCCTTHRRQLCACTRVFQGVGSVVIAPDDDEDDDDDDEDDEDDEDEEEDDDDEDSEDSDEDDDEDEEAEPVVSAGRPRRRRAAARPAGPPR